MDTCVNENEGVEGNIDGNQRSQGINLSKCP